MKTLVKQLQTSLNEAKTKIKLLSDIKSSDGTIPKGSIVTVKKQETTSKAIIYQVEVITGDTAEIIVSKNDRFPHKFV